MAPPPVRITRKFSAPADAVYDAWVDPGLMRRWLFRGPTSEILEVKADPREGGRFFILERNKGEVIDHFGVYQTVERPLRLVFTLEVPKHFAGVTRVELDIAPREAGCQMAFTQSGVEPETTEANWRRMFETLGVLLEDSAEHVSPERASQRRAARS